MPEEILLRRPEFLPGMSIRLGDGRAWIFPAPPGDGRGDRGLDAERVGLGPDYPALVAAVSEAEDPPERLRAELALAIALLAHNYDLGPVEFQDLLRFPTGSPELAEVQQAFHELAREHVRALRGRDMLAPRAWDRAEDRRRTWKPVGLRLWGLCFTVRRGARPIATSGRAR